MLAAVAAHIGVFVFGYLLGSIPFGVILTQLAGTGDVRSIGSGNIGATNVLRTGRKELAAATLLGDMLKGTAAVLVIAYFDRGGLLPLVAGFGAFIGHLFPVWLRFKGGKGVATYIGILVALAWPVAIAFCLVWLAIAALTRYSSLAGLMASAATPVSLWFYGQRPEALLFLVLTVLLWVRHHENIARLISGTESKLGSKSATPAG
jgi:glycerol-3-phosphate acyltransferase PlsY